MVESLQKAWELVGDKLRDHGKYCTHTLTPLLSTFIPSPSLPPFSPHSSPPSLPPSHNTARLKVEDKHLLPSFTLDTSLEYLIPTTVGAGACTTALTDFLVLTHNNFMEKCRGIVLEQKQR